VSTWLFGDAPRYHKGTVTNLIFSIGIGLFALFNILYLMSRNKAKASESAILGRSENEEEQPETTTGGRPGDADDKTVAPARREPLDDRDARFRYTL
jgi:hypothetical protein